MPEGRKFGLGCWSTVMYTGLSLLTVFRLTCSELFFLFVSSVIPTRTFDHVLIPPMPVGKVRDC